MQENKNLVQEALVQMKNVEQAIAENAKGILQSTMKEEISQLVKESLSEQDEEEVELDAEVDSEPSDDMDADNEDEMDMELDMDIDSDEESPIDLTDASDEEILRVFKAMGEEDGIIIKKDGDDVHLKDNNADVEYLVKLGESKKEKMYETMEMEEMDDLETEKVIDAIFSTDGETSEMESDEEEMDEVMYEIEFNEQEEDEEEMDEEEDINESEDMDNEEMNEFFYGVDDEEEDEQSPMGSTSKSWDISRKPKMIGSFDDEHGWYDDIDREFNPDDLSDYDEEEFSDFDSLMSKHGKNQRWFNQGEDGREFFKRYQDSFGGKPLRVRTPKSGEMDEYLDEAYNHKKAKKSETKEGKKMSVKPKGIGIGSGPKFKYNDKSSGGFKEDKKEGPKSIGTGKAKFEYKKGANMDGKSKVVKKAETKEAARTLGMGSAFRKGGLPKPRAHSKVNSAIKESLEAEVMMLREKNEEYRKALNIFREKLNEVAVFNSNLAYATRLFTEHSTTKKEKINILRRFDNVESLKESKSLYKSMKDELSKSETKPINESVERKLNKTVSSGSSTTLIESKTYENPQFLRMKDLMSKLG